MPVNAFVSRSIGDRGYSATIVSFDADRAQHYFKRCSLRPEKGWVMIVDDFDACNAFCHARIVRNPLE